MLWATRCEDEFMRSRLQTRQEGKTEIIDFSQINIFDIRAVFGWYAGWYIPRLAILTIFLVSDQTKHSLENIHFDCFHRRWNSCKQISTKINRQKRNYFPWFCWIGFFRLFSSFETSSRKHTQLFLTEITRRVDIYIKCWVYNGSAQTFEPRTYWRVDRVLDDGRSIGMLD